MTSVYSNPTILSRSIPRRPYSIVVGKVVSTAELAASFKKRSVPGGSATDRKRSRSTLQIAQLHLSFLSWELQKFPRTASPTLASARIPGHAHDEVGCRRLSASPCPRDESARTPPHLLENMQRGKSNRTNRKRSERIICLVLLTLHTTQWHALQGCSA